MLKQIKVVPSAWSQDERERERAGEGAGESANMRPPEATVGTEAPGRPAPSQGRRTGGPHAASPTIK